MAQHQYATASDHHTGDLGFGPLKVMSAATAAAGPPAVLTLLIDDSTLHRENLAAVLSAAGLETPVMAWDADSVLAALRHALPQIVLVNMVTRDNIVLVRLVRENCPGTKVIIVGAAIEDEAAIVSFAEAGVAGYHLRTDSLGDLVQLIRTVTMGDLYCPPEVSAILLKRLSALAHQRKPVFQESPLTTREVEILRMLESGLSNREIADQLCIAVHTVKNHVHSVLRKLGVGTRMEAAALSRASGSEGN